MHNFKLNQFNFLQRKLLQFPKKNYLCTKNLTDKFYTNILTTNNLKIKSEIKNYKIIT